MAPGGLLSKPEMDRGSVQTEHIGELQHRKSVKWLSKSPGTVRFKSGSRGNWSNSVALGGKRPGPRKTLSTGSGVGGTAPDRKSVV